MIKTYIPIKIISSESKNMANTSEANYIKLAQFEAAIEEKKLDDEKILVVIERLINQGLDVNYRLRPTTSFKFEPNYLGCTALHLALDYEELDVFRSLLKHGADFAIKNDEGKTVVHQALERSSHRKEACWTLQGQLKHPFIDAVLEKQINSENSANPYSEDGLSHFHAACITNNAKAVKFFLNNGAPVNKAINKDSRMLPGYTPLHLAVRYGALEVADLLLDEKANLHFENTDGMNPVHMLTGRIMRISNWFEMGKRARCERVLNQFLLDQQILQQLFNKSYTYKYLDWTDDIGFSCLHIGCFMQVSSILKLLCERGYNMTLAIKVDSPIWPGYTALHFAVQFHFGVTMYLLEQGADILGKDAKGVTPLDLMLQLYRPKSIHSVILSQDAWRNIVFSDAKTKLSDLVLAMDSRNAFESFLKGIDAGVNIRLPADSPIWPGFTPLHLAVIFPDRMTDVGDLRLDIDFTNKSSSSQKYNCSREGEELYFDRIKICTNLGADITIKNAEGVTPLHLAFERQKDNVVDHLLQGHEKALNIVDSTGVSYFHIACAARNTLVAEKLLLEGVDVDGRLPSRLSYRRVCEAKESREITHLDAADIQIRIVAIEMSSKLHVFHASSGSTPLHIAVAAQCPELMDALLKQGADVYATDCNGLTPLHRMLSVENPQKFASCLESMTDLRDRTLVHGLSHLHVACLVGSESCARRLLERGANWNLETAVTHRHSKLESKKTSNYDSEFIDPYDDPSAEPMAFLAPYSGCRPLHFAVKANSPSVVKVLLERGADILAKNAEGLTPLYSAFADEKNSCRDLLIGALESSADLQKRMREETGLTMLHFLCYLADEESITDKLIEETDVNARAHENSPLWAGCTPLHVLMKAPHKDDDQRVRVITVLMLARGADVTAVNVESESPIHVAYSRDCCHDEQEIRAHSFIVDMLKAQKDFSANPVSHEGISHFHIACMWDVKDVVEKFLSSGVDPNEPIDYFKKSLVARLEHSNFSFIGGSSPIQLALIHRSKKVFSLLLKWGVNLQAVDRQGRTLLNVAAAYISQDKSYFQLIVKYMKRSTGYNFRRVRQIDLNAEDIYGITALERTLILFTIEDEIVKILIKEGCRVNAFNSVTEEGNIALSIPTLDDTDKPRPVFELLMKAPSVLEIDDRGRNAIHNAVSRKRSFFITSSCYLYVIGRITQLGCDINLQDRLGRTPLHLAVQFQNLMAIIGLLGTGADINLLDANQKPAFAYTRGWASNDHCEEIINMFLAFVHLHQLCGLHVNEVNKEVYREHMETRQFVAAFQERNRDELAKLKERRIGEYSITLRDFLSETGAVAAYPHMLAEQRQVVDEFFQSQTSNLREDFVIFSGLLLLQYGKARKRVGLLVKATCSLNVLTGLELPYLCSKSILKFFSNADLELLIASNK